LILKTEPNNFKVRVFLAYVLLERLNKVEEAAAIFDKLYAEKPKSLWIQKFMGILALKQKKVADAYKLFLGVWKEDPKDFESVFYVCKILLASKQYPTALSVSLAAMKQYPNNYTMLGNVIEALIRQDKWKEAVPFARKQLQMRQTGTSVVRTLLVLGAARDLTAKDTILLQTAQKSFKPNDYINYAIAVFKWKVRNDKVNATKIFQLVSKTKNPMLKKVAERDLKEISQ
ncbi:MAG: hypothetical protein P1V97_25790, partial [Planctomycetota bacterium]|nr:hypothetical protein [Planctomycetota bacterium]